MKLQEISRRQRSLRTTEKISSAMKMVAQAKWQQLRKHMQHIREINSTFEEMRHYLHLRPIKKPRVSFILVLMGERGLCGGFYKTLHQYALEVMPAHPNAILFYMGSKGASLEPLGAKPLPAPLRSMNDIMLAYDALSMYLRSGETFGVLYHNGTPVLEYASIYEELDGVMLTYEPLDRGVFMRHFHCTAHAVFLAGCLARHYIQEERARMIAMEQAQRNNADLLEDLGRAYHNQRQSIITQQIIEIVSGAESLS